MIQIETSLTLLQQLQDKHNAQARERFVEVYGRLIEGLAVYFGARGDEVKEITDEVVLRILKYIFTYKPEKGSFRAWLKSVTNNAWRDFVKHARRGQSVGGTDWVEIIRAIPAQQEFEKRMDEGSLLYLLDCAMDEVKQNVSKVQWNCFHAFHIEGLTGEQVADKVSIHRDSVYQNNKSVKDMLKVVFERMQNENP